MKRPAVLFYVTSVLVAAFLMCHAWVSKSLAQYPTAYQTGAYQQAPAPDNVLIILDGSQSMAEPINMQETKMVAAKRTILGVLQNIPPNVPVGLRVYGQSRNEWDACRSSDLVVPIAPNSRYAVSAQLLKVRPRGATPISYSIKKAVDGDFVGRPGKKTIILVSDGMETCDADPCDLAVSLMRSGADVKINVIGYGIQDVAAMKQLKCVALATKGRFYSANTSAALANSLGEAMGAQKSVQAQVFIPKSGSNAPVKTAPGNSAPAGYPMPQQPQQQPYYGPPQYRIGY